MRSNIRIDQFDDEIEADIYTATIEKLIMQFGPPEGKPRAPFKLLVPHCDCEELNAINNNYRSPYASANQLQDPDVPYMFFATELNAKRNCKHCNYAPRMMERES